MENSYALKIEKSTNFFGYYLTQGGKSTILNLIAKYYTPQGGSVSIGSKETADVPSEQVLSCISLVDQDVFLFNDTISNNIRYARQSATEEEIRKACRLANCEGFIRKMEHGYDTMIGENGNRLSGGERQRLSVARAILKDSPVILLDVIYSTIFECALCA